MNKELTKKELKEQFHYAVIETVCKNSSVPPGPDVYPTDTDIQYILKEGLVPKDIIEGILTIGCNMGKYHLAIKEGYEGQLNPEAQEILNKKME